ncbi:MAG: YraN family protein [Candidatus Carbobacillus sp.]|nr:YraN family protein [Candidatus Carbobacillus sp.]
MAEKGWKDASSKRQVRPDDRRAFGWEAEALALRYLEAKGFRLLDHNYRTSFGEIDLIGLLDGRMVFVEVRARRSDRFGTAKESISEKKIRTLRRVALSFLHTNSKRLPVHDGLRFDVITVFRDQHGQHVIEHFPAAF